jgi:hypothetical protein
MLVLMSLVLGVFTQILFWGTSSRWLWVPVSVAFFVLGLFISEVWFGWATEAELQPNIGGLSFDEVLLGFMVAAAVIVLVRILVARGHRHAVT